MKYIFEKLGTGDLWALSGAIQSDRLKPPYSTVALQRFVSDDVAPLLAAEFAAMHGKGVPPAGIAWALEALAEDRERSQEGREIDLVWTGPEAPGVANRDTAVVVRELFSTAEESVLVAGFAVYQGQSVFKALADRMDANPSLQVEMYLDVHRPYKDESSESELVQRFAYRFKNSEWPGRRFPKVFYDPRSLVQGNEGAVLHAKCVVVDRRMVFVTSANFTEAAQLRNIELGLLVDARAVGEKIEMHFRKLASGRMLKALPL